jgi:hypothetical protein
MSGEFVETSQVVPATVNRAFSGNAGLAGASTTLMELDGFNQAP